MPDFHLDDGTLHYETTGDGEPLLLLHGLGSSTRDWQLQTPALASRYRLIAMDCRGHGRSSLPRGPVSLTALAADAAALLRHLDASPAHVLGLSLGGMIALQLALDHPQVVRRLVLSNTAPEITARTPAQRRALAVRLAAVRVLPPRLVGWLIGRKLFPRPDQGLLRREITTRWAMNDRRGFGPVLHALAGWSVTERLPELAHPALVVTGDREHLPFMPAAEFARQLPNGRLVVLPDSGHASPIDSPDAFNRLVLAFLAGAD